MAWTPRELTSQSGKTFVITGANSGIGLEAAKLLAAHGGRIIMACRTPATSEAALAEVRAGAQGAEVDLVRLDLADLASVREAAAEVSQRCNRVDALINNAGVMAIPRRQTADGFEMQLGTNHLGHFAWTAHLMERVLAAEGRVVVLSSNAHRLRARIDFDDLMAKRRYRRWKVYGQSKLANIMFALELQRRLSAADKPSIAVACHPGYASTRLQLRGAEMRGSRVRKVGMALVNRLVSQSAERGAWPTVRAATDPDAKGGEYYGPRSPGELWGAVKPARVARRARDEEVARRLWRVSEELTGVSFQL